MHAQETGTENSFYTNFETCARRRQLFKGVLLWGSCRRHYRRFWSSVKMQLWRIVSQCPGLGSSRPAWNQCPLSRWRTRDKQKVDPRSSVAQSGWTGRHYDKMTKWRCHEGRAERMSQIKRESAERLLQEVALSTMCSERWGEWNVLSSGSEAENHWSRRIPLEHGPADKTAEWQHSESIICPQEKGQKGQCKAAQGKMFQPVTLRRVWAREASVPGFRSKLFTHQPWWPSAVQFTYLGLSLLICKLGRR